MSERPSFGSHFEVFADNRMDPLKDNSERPEYLNGADEVRALLREAAAEDKEWKKIPEVNSVEDVFEKAKNKVSEVWHAKVSALVAEKCAAWAAQLDGNEQYAKERELLSDPDSMEQKIAIRQFGLLESLRDVLPEAWKELVSISAERQLAAIEVARTWVLNIDELKDGQIIKDCGLKSKAELSILVDSAAILGKFIDHAYIKQMQLADMPGGKEKTPLLDSSIGARYLYDIDKNGDGSELSVLSYAEVFPFEINEISKRFTLLSKKVDEAYKNGKLGDEYKNLAAYLQKMSETYGSKITDTQQVAREWQEINDAMSALYADGCPVMFIPQTLDAVSGDAGKIDVELRMGYITKESREISESFKGLRAVVAEELEAMRPYLSKDYVVPDVIVNYQPFAFGRNNFWTLRGESGYNKITAHTNAVVDVAESKSLPALHSVFDEDIDVEEFKRGSIVLNALHELGHVLPPLEDPNVAARVGSSLETYIAEELKADSNQAKIVKKYIEQNPGGAINEREHLIAQLGDVCDYLKNKSDVVGTSGERYYYDGIEIIYNLIKEGVIVEQGDKFVIADAKKGIDVLAGISDKLMEYYLRGKPEQLQEYSGKIRDKKNDPQVQKFLALLKK